MDIHSFFLSWRIVKSSSLFVCFSRASLEVVFPGVRKHMDLILYRATRYLFHCHIFTQLKRMRGADQNLLDLPEKILLHISPNSFKYGLFLTILSLEAVAVCKSQCTKFEC